VCMGEMGSWWCLRGTGPALAGKLGGRGRFCAARGRRLGASNAGSSSVPLLPQRGEVIRAKWLSQ